MSRPRRSPDHRAIRRVPPGVRVASPALLPLRPLLLLPLFVLLLVICAPTATGARPADDPRSAEPEAATSRLLDELGVDAQPADFYIVLDVSTSMLDDGNYDAAKAALKDFLPAVPAGDRISVIRFGARTTTHLPLTKVPRGDREIAAFLDSLPRPNDTESDFGAAMVSVSEIIARDDRAVFGYRPPTVIVVLTDAELYAPDNPAFANAKAPGWATLKHEYAKAVERRGPIDAYALPLGDNARGVNLIAEVLPQAQTLSGTVSQQAARLRALEHEARKRKGVELVRADNTATVRATFGPGPASRPGVRPSDADCADSTAPVGPVDLSTRTVLCLTLTTTSRHISTTVTDLRTGDPELDRGLPRTPIVVEPGVPRRLPVELRARDRTRSDLFGRSRDYTAATTLSGTVTATRAAEFAALLRLDGPYTAPRLLGGELDYTGRVRGSVTWWVWESIALTLVLTAATTTAIWRLFPKDAYLELSLEDRRHTFPEAAPFRVRGLRHRWVHEPPSSTGATTTFLARGRRPRAGRGVTVTARHEHGGVVDTARRRLRVGESTMLFGICVRTLPRPAPAAPAAPVPPRPSVVPPSPGPDPEIEGSGGMISTDPGEQPKPVEATVTQPPNPRPPR
ncbi:vWA domain-containing protein [Embleya sp. NPDC001921]